jgi:hypothetical protein
MKHLAAVLLVLVSAYAQPSTAHAERPAATRLETSEAAPKQENAKKKKLSDAQIRKVLIEESIAAYSGNCPCPYSRASNGSRCGRRSAHSRAGGEAPLCFDSDVTKEMVQAYRHEHAED